MCGWGEDELRGGLAIGCREGAGKGCGEVEHGGLEGELVNLAESVQNFLNVTSRTCYDVQALERAERG